MADNDVLVTIGADIGDICTKLNTVKKQLSSIGTETEKSTAPVGDSFSKLGSIAGKLGGVMAAAFSVKKIFDFAVSVGQTGMAFETSMSKVSAISGATGDELKKLSDYARDMAKTTVWSASETADAMQYMSLAGWDSTQIMSGLKGVLDLASAGQLELAFASDVVTDTLSMFNMSAEESTRMVDVMAQAQAKSNTNITQLSEALKYAGGTASTFGMDIEQTSAALGVLANNGIKGSMAGSSLRSILSRLAAPTKDVTEALATLNVEVANSDGSLKSFDTILTEIKGSFNGLSNAQQVQIAKQIAGQEAMSSFIYLVNSADTDLQKLTGQMYESSGAAEKMSNTMTDNLSGSLKMLSSGWEELKLKLYDIGAGPTKAVVDGLTSIIDTLNSVGDTGLEWKDGFGEAVSTATSEAIINFQDMNRNIQGTIDQMNFLGGTVTQEFYNNMIANLGSWKEQSDTLLAEKYAQDLTALQEYFANNSAITESEREAMITKLNEFYGREREGQQRQSDEMLAIIQGAFDEKRNLTSNELARLNELQNRNYADLLALAATSQDEELALLQACADEKGRISAEASEKAYASAKETRDRIVEEAKATRDEDIKQAYRLKEAGVIQESEYEAMVKTAEDKYSEIESKANESFREVYRAVSQNAIDMGKDFNFETGKIENQWWYFCKFIAGKTAQFDAVYRVNVEHTTTYNTKQGTTSGANYSVGRFRAIQGASPMARLSDGASLPETYATTNVNHSESNGGINISMSGVVIREEADIKKVAQELYKIQQRNKRAKGVVAYV